MMVAYFHTSETIGPKTMAGTMAETLFWNAFLNIHVRLCPNVHDCIILGVLTPKFIFVSFDRPKYKHLVKAFHWFGYCGRPLACMQTL